LTADQIAAEFGTQTWTADQLAAQLAGPGWPG
jgi:hypothetical protein